MRFALNIVSACSVIAGTSCLAFVIASFVKERNARLFRLLNHMGAGVALGMALIALPNDAQLSFGKLNDFMFNGLVTAFSFIAMIVVEHIAAIGGNGEFCLSSYSYKPVSSISDDDEGGYEEENLVGDDDDLSGDTFDNDVREIEMQSRALSPIRRQRTEATRQQEAEQQGFQKRRFFPSCILVVVSVYEAFYGGSVALSEHTGFGSYLQIVTHTVLLSFTFGLMLGFLMAPRHFFVWFMTIFSFSTSTGILICSLLPDSYSDDVSYYKGYCAIISAGVFLYLSTIHILPAELLYDTTSASFIKAEDDEEDEEIAGAEEGIDIWSDKSKSVTSRILYLVMKVAALTIGFALVALPTILLELDIFVKRARPRAPVPAPIH